MKPFTRKIAKLTLSITALAIIVFKLFAGTLAYSEATLTSDIGSGHTVPVFVHGRTVYLTQDQVDREGALHWTNLAVFGALAMLVVLSVGKNRGSGKDGA